MVDPEVFAEGMARLAGALKMGDVESPVAAMYYRIIGPQLTNEEWLRAVELTAATERFWPSPAVILEKIRPGDSVFQRVADALSHHGGYRWLPADVSRAWDAPTWAGIKAIGGLQAITNCEGERKWDRLKREFAAAYADALSPRPALTNGEKPDPRVKLLTNGIGNGGRDKAIPTGDR